MKKVFCILFSVMSIIFVSTVKISAQECVQTWVPVDTTNPKHVRDLKIFRQIFTALDSASKTGNYVTLKDGTKLFFIGGGEFILLGTNPRKFAGTVLFEKYEIDEESLIYHSFGKYSDFGVGTKMFWHQTKSAGKYPYERMIELLAQIRRN